MGDHLRFFSSHSPDSSRSYGHSPDPYGPKFADPWANPGAYSQDDYIQMARDEMQSLISTDGPTTSWLYSDYYSQPPKGGNYGPPSPPLARPNALQKKMNVGSASVPLEQEADAVADRVMRDTKDCYLDPPVSPFRKLGPRQPGEEAVARQGLNEQEQETAQLKAEGPEISRMTEQDEEMQSKSLQRNLARIDADAKETLGYTHAFEKSDDEEDPGTTTSTYMQRDAQGHGAEGGPVSPDLEQRIEGVRNSGGERLPESEREFFESRMGRDFSDVRIYTESEAAQVSRDVNAKAFTIGRDVVFGEGEYKPGTSDGRRLMAHELTHTVQQGAASGMSQRTWLQRYWTEQGMLTDTEAGKARTTDLLAAPYSRNLIAKWVNGDSAAILKLVHKEFMIQALISARNDNRNQEAMLNLLEFSEFHHYRKLIGYMSTEVVKNFAEQNLERFGQIRENRADQTETNQDTFSADIVRDIMLAMQANAARWRHLVGNSKDCVTAIREIVLPGLYRDKPELRATILNDVEIACGDMNRMMDVMQGMGESGHASEKIEIEFDRKYENRDVKGEHSLFRVPTTLKASVSKRILEMAGAREGWHAFGLALMDSYHSVTLFVNIRPGGPFIYWSDQIPSSIVGTKTFEAGSISGFRRYEPAALDQYIEIYTRSRWEDVRSQSRSQKLDYKTRTEIWKLRIGK